MGLIGVAIIALIILTIVRQRRARQLDREIAGTSSPLTFPFLGQSNLIGDLTPTSSLTSFPYRVAAAAGANFDNAAFDDDPRSDFERHNSGGGVSSSYYPTSNQTHGTYNQPPMEMQQGHGGQWDPYANQPGYGTSGAPGAYGMAALGMPNRERRTSTGTGTSAGVAGFGARGLGAGGAGAGAGAGAGYPPYDDHLSNSGGHEQYYGNTNANTGGYGGAAPGDYYDPYSHTGAPGAVGAVGAAAYNHHAQQNQGQGHQHDDEYHHNDAYGGEEEYEHEPAQPQFLHGGHRQDSSGTYRDDQEPLRTLKVRSYFLCLLVGLPC